MLKKFVNLNMRASSALDACLPVRLTKDGNRTFLQEVLPDVISKNDVVYDLGGGSQPYLSLADKAELSVTQIGLDIDAEELDAAPEGTYDQKIVHDLCTYVGNGDGDVIICQSTLEHVPDTAGAIRAMATTIKPGGMIYVFAPCRNALFARLNMILPERVKKKILFKIFPSKAQGHDGFKAYYDKCIPSQIETLAKDNDLEIAKRQLFWKSSYFGALFPVYVIARLIQGALALIIKDDAAETFIYVLRKPL